MIIDTSAIMAIVLHEGDADRFADAIAAAVRPLMTAPTLVELRMVAERRGGAGGARQADRAIADGRIEIVQFTAEHAVIAQEGWRVFGRGRHPAGLNFGDCFSYALAKVRGERLLFKGDDFSRTDVLPAIAPHG